MRDQLDPGEVRKVKAPLSTDQRKELKKNQWTTVTIERQNGIVEVIQPAKALPTRTPKPRDMAQFESFYSQ